MFFFCLEGDFDPTVFEKILSELFSSDPSLLKETSIDLFSPLLEPEPLTREMGTDPMEPSLPALPIIINTNNGNPLTTKPIFLIQTNTPPVDNSLSFTTTTTIPTEYYDFQVDPSSFTMNDYPMDDGLPLTPSTSSDSPDEPRSHSPDNAHSSMLTNFEVNKKTEFSLYFEFNIFLSEFTSQWSISSHQ